MSNITDINIWFGSGTALQSSIPQFAGNSENSFKLIWSLGTSHLRTHNIAVGLMSLHSQHRCVKVYIILAFILAFSAAALRFCIVGTTILENMRDGYFNRPPAIVPHDVESLGTDVDVSGSIDIEINADLAPSSEPDTPEQVGMSTTGSTSVSLQRFGITPFRAMTAAAMVMRGVLWPTAPDVDVSNGLLPAPIEMTSYPSS